MTVFPSSSFEPGLPADRSETGSVLRIKDILSAFDPAVSGQGSTLIGFASDEGVRRNFGRVGAEKGPEAIRKFLFSLPVHGPFELSDAGNIACADGRLEQAQSNLADEVVKILESGRRPVVLGGGHEVAFGSFQGLVRFLGQRCSERRIAIVNLDAHFDLRLADKPNSGTPFRQISELCAEKGTPFSYLCFGISSLGNTAALFERAKQLGVYFRHDEELRERNLPAILADFREKLSGFDDIYLSVDLDVLPGSAAPGVSAPAARGVALEIVEDLIDTVICSGKLRLADIAELNPTYDCDNRTARIAARIAYRLITAP